KRIHDDVPGPGRWHLGQDHLPRPAAFGVRSPGGCSRAGHTEPLSVAGSRPERRDHRRPRGCCARLQPASGGRDVEYGSSTGASEGSALWGETLFRGPAVSRKLAMWTQVQVAWPTTPARWRVRICPPEWYTNASAAACPNRPLDLATKGKHHPYRPAGDRRMHRRIRRNLRRV